MHNRERSFGSRFEPSAMLKNNQIVVRFLQSQILLLNTRMSYTYILFVYIFIFFDTISFGDTREEVFKLLISKYIPSMTFPVIFSRLWKDAYPLSVALMNDFDNFFIFYLFSEYRYTCPDYRSHITLFEFLRTRDFQPRERLATANSSKNH